MINLAVPAPSFVVKFSGPYRTPTHPRLGNVHLRRIGDSHPLAVLGPDLARLRLGGFPSGLTEAHAAHDDGSVTGLSEVVSDLGGVLLLGELHLEESVVDGFPRDLAGKVHKFLGGGGHARGLEGELALSAGDVLSARDVAVALRQLDHLLALPAEAATRVRVEEDGGRSAGDWGTRGASVHAAGIGLDVLLEDRVAEGRGDALRGSLAEGRFVKLLYLGS